MCVYAQQAMTNRTPSQNWNALACFLADHAQEIRLDERRLSDGLGVSSTPIREAMTLLKQEVFVHPGSTLK
jgi:hypothetical protein